MLITTENATPSTNQVRRVAYQVVHRNERRVRLVVPSLAFDTAYTEALKNLVESIDDVTYVRINSAAKSIAVEFDYKVDSSKVAIAQEQVFALVEQASYTETNNLHVPVSVQQNVDYWQRLGLPFIGLTMALLAGPFEVSIPFLLIAGLMASAAVPIFSRAIAGIKDEGKYKVDVLDSLWITLHTLQGQYVAPALMVSLVEAGEAFRDLTARANQNQTLELLDSSDHFVWVEQDGTEKQIPLLEVQKGDQVIVHSGKPIPVDGRILHGTALINEHNVNGEATPVTCIEGQQVYASTQVVQGNLCIIAERTGKETFAALMTQFLQAPVISTQVENSVKEVSDKLVLPTMFLSGSIFALTGNISPALAPLQLDFGTGIGIAVPTTILAALSSLARCGVFIRNGHALEVLARTDTIVFGKTETLTSSESASAIADLKNQGIEIYLLTGDNQQALETIATHLGIKTNNTYSSALPKQKIEVVHQLHNEGKIIAYVGDGLSDSEVLADADISIFFAEGTDIERETADIVIVDNDLRRLNQAIAIAKQAMELVYQNIAIVAVPNISVVIAGIFFGLDPVAAVLINNCAVLIAEMNGSRPRLLGK